MRRINSRETIIRFMRIDAPKTFRTVKQYCLYVYDNLPSQRPLVRSVVRQYRYEYGQGEVLRRTVPPSGTRTTAYVVPKIGSQPRAKPTVESVLACMPCWQGAE
eukprot:scaffold180665_cov23-Prasinocladus_malaysianus.AAC.1